MTLAVIITAFFRAIINHLTLKTCVWNRGTDWTVAMMTTSHVWFRFLSFFVQFSFQYLLETTRVYIR